MASGLITAKFGGSSVATAGMIQVVRDIVRADEHRRAIVVSAPGARYEGDTKVTDLLEGWATNKGVPFDGHYLDVEHRFSEIHQGLGLEDFDIMLRFSQMMAETEQTAEISHDLLKQFAMSRGEWLHAQIVAHVLGFEFIDAADFISFDNEGLYDHERTKLRASLIRLRERARDGIVVPGYYGSMENGSIATFPRDGSDISGSIVAALTGSDLYENFTDTEGFRAVSPKIMEGASRIKEMSFGEARELSFMGSSILHPQAMKHVHDMGIPIHVRKTTRLLTDGTWIRPWIDEPAAQLVTGIAVRTGGTIISIEKYGMDEEVGFLARTAAVFADLKIGIHNCPGSVDTLSFIVLDPSAREHIPEICRRLEVETGAEVRVMYNIAIICVVGRGMMHAVGVTAMLTNAIADAGVNIVMLNQGSSERNVEIGVSDDDAEKAVRAIYRVFFGS